MALYIAHQIAPENNDNPNLLRAAAGKNLSHLLILGDFNYPEIEWSSRSVSCSPSHPPFKFLKTVRDIFLSQHSLEPTHHRGDQRANVLDLIFTNEENMITEVLNNAPIGKSHHSVLSFVFKCYGPRENTQQPRLIYDRGDYEAVRVDLGGVDWETILKDKNTEETWQIIQLMLHKMTDKHIPKQNQKPGLKRKKALWMNVMF